MVINIDFNGSSEINNPQKTHKKKKSKKDLELYLYSKRERKKIKRRKNQVKKKMWIERNNLKSNENTYKSFEQFIRDTDFLGGSPFDEKIRVINDKYVIEIPKVFSLIHNPDEVINTFKQIYYLGQSNKTKGLFFDHSNCEDLELGASAVMDVIVMNIQNQRKLQNKRLNFSGAFPKDSSLTEMLYVSGLLKQLDVDTKTTRLVHKYKENLLTLDLIRGGQSSSTLNVFKSMNSAIASTRVIEHFENCLRTQKYDLTFDERRYFSRLIGEAIDNCNNHSGEFCQWFVLGHYDIEDGKSYGEFKLTLFNFGNSIYESLKNTELNDQLSNNLERLTRIHVKGRKSIWDEEVLWTLYALQEGVSRLKDDGPKNKDRGVGTIKLIDAFQKIGKTTGEFPLMSIISGHTYILFDNIYKLGETIVEGTPFKSIAFNETNDLDLPPDPNNVRRLSNYFPGTVITMKFYLDRDHIENNIKENDENVSKIEEN